MLKKLKNILDNEFDPAFEKRAKFIFQIVERYRPKKILDVGCGRGFYLKALSFYSFPEEIHGVDINYYYLNISRKICDDQRVKIKQASIYSLPYPSSYFDFIIASEIIEHLKDDKKALLELKRVLKPGGILVITVPNKNFPFLWDPLNWFLMKFFKTHVEKGIWWLAGIWADHERLYTTDNLKNLAINSGFKIKKFEYFIHWCWPFSHLLLYGIGKNLVEKLNLKQFNRFNFQDKKSFLSILAFFFKLPSMLMDNKKNLKKQTSVNICILVTPI